MSRELLIGPHTYQLAIAGDSYKAALARPATQPDLPKLYAISRAGKLYYVGISNTRMSARLSLGMRAKVKSVKGFHGYKLPDGIYRLDVWVGDVSRNDLECIEAEVAYYWRHHHGNWPEAQNEIHFHATRQEHRDAALSVISSITKGPKSVT